MKRTTVCSVMALLAVSTALSALAQAPPAMDRRPPGIARPVGSGNGGPGNGGPGRPGGGGTVKPPPRPMPGRPSVRPPSGGHHRPPPRPVHRPINRPIYGWNGHRYRAGPFRYPAGFAYRRWSIGQALPALLFSSAYYFTNYAVLGLDPPPYGYQWVRYGPDVLLVNIRTGEVLDVINNAFY